MRTAVTAKSSISVRRSRPTDLDRLSELEIQVFSINRMSRRSLRWLLASPSAEVLIAEACAEFAGAAVVLFRANSKIARLYFARGGAAPVRPRHRLGADRGSGKGGAVSQMPVCAARGP